LTHIDKTRLSKLLELLLLALRETQKREKEKETVFRTIEMQMSEQGEIVFLCECVCVSLDRRGGGSAEWTSLRKRGLVEEKQPHTHSPVHTATADDVTVCFSSPREFEVFFFLFTYFLTDVVAVLTRPARWIIGEQGVRNLFIHNITCKVV